MMAAEKMTDVLDIKSALGRGDHAAAASLLSDVAVKLREPTSRIPFTEAGLPDQVKRCLDDSEASLELMRQAARATANLVIDEDSAREAVQASGYVTRISERLQGALIDGRLNAAAVPFSQAAAVSLLNLSMGEIASVKLDIAAQASALVSSANAVYSPFESPAPEDVDDRAAIAGWLWRTVGEALAVDGAVEAIQSDLAHHLVDAIRSFRQPPTSGVLFDPDLAEVDVQILSTSCACLEVIATRSEVVEALFRKRGTSTPIEEVMDFAELASFPLQWETTEATDEEATTSRPKIFAAAKASLLRAAVEAAADMSPRDPQNQGFWSRMQRWLRLKVDEEHARTDLVSCALLCYGNFARSDSAVKALSGDEGFVSSLQDLLRQASKIEDAGVRHGLIGLLKNLCLPRYFKDRFGRMILSALLEMDVWAASNATLGTVQGGAVVVARLLCRDNLSNTLLVIDQALEQLLELFNRTDDQAIKCEVLRTLVAMIKTLWSQATGQHNQARVRLSDADVVVPLTQCGRQYPVLTGEVIFALTLLLDTQAAKVIAERVSDKFLDYILGALRDDQLPPQVRSNICLFLFKVRASKPSSTEDERIVEALREATENPMTSSVAQQALHAWQT